MPYILERAAQLKVVEFDHLGRDALFPSVLQMIQTYTASWVKSKRRMASTSNQASAHFHCEGRLFFDCQRIIQTQHALRTYTLQECCHEFLGKPEEHWNDITTGHMFEQACQGVQGLLKRGRSRSRSISPTTTVATESSATKLMRLTTTTNKTNNRVPNEPSLVKLEQPTPSTPPGRRSLFVSTTTVSSTTSSSTTTSSLSSSSKTISNTSTNDDTNGHTEGVDQPLTILGRRQWERRIDGRLRSMARFVTYVARQSEIPILLLNKLMILVSTMEMARATGINIRDVWTRGQMIRTWNLLLRNCRRLDYLLPTEKSNASLPVMTQGPIGFDPAELKTFGMHESPVAVLDFASLYPSVMIGFNLCYSTLLVKEDEKLFGDDQTHRAPDPVKRRWVKQSVRRGVIPQILEGLLGSRARVKAAIETVDSFTP
jgi:DNA polymerase elongation subunit (family B)